MKLGARLGASFGAVLVLSALIAVGGSVALQSSMGSFRAVTHDVLPKSDIAVSNIQAAYDYARAFAYIIASEVRADVDTTALKAAESALVDTVQRQRGQTGADAQHRSRKGLAGRVESQTRSVLNRPGF